MKNNNYTKPFLRWAGGKGWLIKYLEMILGDLKFNDYHELFLGGGAVFFALNPKGNVYLGDINEELIHTYKMICSEPNIIIDQLEKFENTKDFYYKIRSSNFKDPIMRAVRFIYLNKTSFNGLYRVNRNGEYNVPYGNIKRYNIESENIINVSKRLKNAKIASGDFYRQISNIKKNDLVILDPPYTVSHNNNGFIEYNKQLFSLDDQYRLKKFIDEVKDREAYYILSNAAHEKIHEIFNDSENILHILTRSSLIGGKNSSRGLVEEYIFTNIKGDGIEE